MFRYTLHIRTQHKIYDFIALIYLQFSIFENVVEIDSSSEHESKSDLQITLAVATSPDQDRFCQFIFVQF